MWLLIGLYFLLTIAVSVFGLETVRVGKAYYRESLVTKTLVERELGLLRPLEGVTDVLARTPNLSIAVTKGMRNTTRIFGTPESEPPIRWGSITGQAQGIFWAMILIEALACLVSAGNFAFSIGR